MERINYLIMNEEDKNSRGEYVPNLDYLIENATCPEEAEKWEELRNLKGDRDFGFAFRVVYATQQKCGHWEIFQHPYTGEDGAYTIESILKHAEEHARDSKCTRCICRW